MDAVLQGLKHNACGPLRHPRFATNKIYFPNLPINAIKLRSQERE